MVLCYSLNVQFVVNTQTLPVQKNLFELFALTGSGDTKPSGLTARAITYAP